MTTTAATRTRARGATVGAVLRSELIKIRSVRSTWVGLAALLGIVGLIVGFGGNQLDGAATPAVFAEWILTVLQLGLFLTVVFFAVQTAGEWSTGMARTTFAAVASRGRWVTGRVLAVTLSGALAGLAVVGAALGLGTLLGGAGADPIGPETQGLLWQVPLVVGLLSGFGAALAVLVRNVWLVVGALATLQFVIGIIAATLFTWLLQVLPYLPFELGHTVLNASQAGADLAGSPGAGLSLALLVAWTVGASIAAAVVSRRRDGA